MKTFIAVKYHLVAQGLMHYLHQTLPEPFIEIVSTDFLRRNRYTDAAVIFLDTSLTSPEIKQDIEKISKNFPECLIVGISEAISDIPINGIFAETLFLAEPEDVLQKKVKNIYDSFEVIPENPAGELLSSREKEILKEVALGHTNKEIGEHLFISPYTVITHRKNITAKLGIKSIAGLTVYAVLNGIVSPNEINL